VNLVMLTLGIGLFLAGTILYLVRRDHLHGPYALGWLALAAVIIAIAAFPRIIDKIGSLVGISYPPILVCLLAIAALLIKSLIGDLER
jgi:ABC-type Fe3+-siderophore transport system permease subunit